MKKIILFSTFANLLIFGNPCVYGQSVGVSGQGLVPNASALLDVDASGMTPKGLLMPRIALTSITDVTTISSPANSLIVYNTGTGMAGGNGVGYYFYCSTGCTPTGWKFMASPSNGPGTSGQVLTSAGSGAAPTWTTPGTGGRPSQWGTESGGTMNWPTCATTCANSTEGGFNDWYMPSVAEWFELNESVPDGTFNGYCWTSTGGSAANFYTMIPNGTGWWLLDYTTNEYCRCIR